MLYKDARQFRATRVQHMAGRAEGHEQETARKRYQRLIRWSSAKSCRSSRQKDSHRCQVSSNAEKSRLNFERCFGRTSGKCSKGIATTRPVADDDIAQKRASALAHAVDDLLETLQKITVAEGRNCLDDFERAVNAISAMQKLAVDVLKKYGFQPRRESLDDD